MKIYKKILNIAILVSFIGVGIFPISTCTSNQSIGFTITVPEDYQTIQEAIDNAKNGDTVYVHSDTYYENIIIDKSLTLQGEDMRSTIIDGSGIGNAVAISANWVNLSGFTIRNSGGEYWWDSGIILHSENNSVTMNTVADNNRQGIVLYHSSDNTIQDNIFMNNEDGIRLSKSSNRNMVSKNIIRNNMDDGIYISVSSNNKILENTITHNKDYGIELYASLGNSIVDNVFQSSGIRFRGNNIEHWNSHIIDNNILNEKTIRYYKNTRNLAVPNDTSQVILANCTQCNIQNLNLSDVDSGIQLGFSADNDISENTIIDNTWYGIILRNSSENTMSGNTITTNRYGIDLREESKNNTIICNTIMKNSEFGISLSGESDYNVISWNNITNNMRYIAIHLSGSSSNNIQENTINNNSGGISLINSLENTLNGNTITNNSWGLDLIDTSNNNMINGNNITDNNGNGIHVWRSSKNNTISGNTIMNNGDYGIELEDSSDDNVIYLNNFINNAQNSYDEGNNKWDNGRQGNYWDDYSGVDENNDGIGETPVHIPGGDNKDYYPFVNLITNYAPNKPSILKGQSHGKTGIVYEYSCLTSDFNADQVWYKWDWGNEVSNWKGPYNSGEGASVNHTWKHQGTYSVKVKAKDTSNFESVWSDPLVVTMPKNKACNLPFIRLLENHSEMFMFFESILDLLAEKTNNLS